MGSQNSDSITKLSAQQRKPITPSKMGSVEVLRDHHNLLDEPPYLQRARMADQLYHSLDRLRMQRTGLLEIEPGRASPVQIKKKLRRLSEAPQRGGSSSMYPPQGFKENVSSLSYSPSRASSVSSTLSRSILKHGYLPSTLTRPKHVHFLSDVTVFQVGEDGTHVCTSSEQLNAEPSSRITHKLHHHVSGSKALGETSQDSTDSSRGAGHLGGAAVVTHAVLDKPGKGKVGVGAVVSSLPTSPQPQNNNYAVTVSTAFPTYPTHKLDSAGQLNSESWVNVQNNPSMSEINTSKLIPTSSNPGRTAPNTVTSSKFNPNNSHSSSSTSSINNSSSSIPNITHNSTIPPKNNHMSGSNNYNSTPNNRNLNISFTQDPTQGTKCKFVVSIGPGYDPEDIVVKANMNGSRIRVMATKVVTRPDGTNDVQQFNERFVLPMDIDPFTVDARLDSKGLLTVEAPLMTLERRQNQNKNDSKNDLNQTIDQQ